MSFWLLALLFSGLLPMITLFILMRDIANLLYPCLLGLPGASANIECGSSGNFRLYTFLPILGFPYFDFLTSVKPRKIFKKVGPFVTQSRWHRTLLMRDWFRCLAGEGNDFTSLEKILIWNIRLSWIIETFLKFLIHVSYDLIGWNVNYDQQSFVHDGIRSRLSISKMLIIHKIDVKDIGHLTILNVIVTYGEFSLWIFAHSRLLLTLYIGLEMSRFFVPVFLVCTLLSRKCSFGYFYLYSRLFHEYL